MEGHDRHRAATDVGAVVGPVALGALLYGLRASLDSADRALLFVAATVAVAAWGRIGPAVVAAVASGLSYDLFCTRPYLSLRISSSDEVVTTVLLLVVGVTVAGLALAGRRARRRADEEAGRLRRLHRLGEQVAAGDPVDVLLMAVAGQLEELLRLRDCRFSRGEVLGAARVEPDGSVTLGGRVWNTVSLGLPTSQVVLPVRAGGEWVATFLLTPTPAAPVEADALLTAVALVDTLGPVLPPVRH